MQRPPAAECAFALRVKRLPGVLSADAVRALLSRYGAALVQPLRRPTGLSSGCERTQSAIARFLSKDAQLRALRRLQGLELAGNALEVVAEDAPAATDATRSADFQPPLPKGEPPPLPPLPPLASAPTIANAVSSAYAPVPLAPHLGLHFSPSPLLEYKYPRATEGIVRNVANALIALPKFYTQVLHLMNKMNLPLPFEDNAIPGIFNTNREERKRPVEPPPSPQFVEEEEEEDEESEEETRERTTGAAIPSSLPVVTNSPARKRPRVGDDKEAKDTRSSLQQVVGMTGQRLLPRKLQLGKASRVARDSSQLSKAFQVADTSQQAHAVPRPGVITAAEVRRRRRSPSEMTAEPAMQNYSRGAPSSVLRVQNLAEAVDEGDLRSIFEFVLPPGLDESLTVSLTASERSAIVTYPTAALATAAIDQLHGVVLEDQPLVVSFYSSVDASREDSTQEPATAEPIPSASNQSTWTDESLDASRLDGAALSAEKAMKNYGRGDRSCTLYVKNLAKSVQLDALQLLFAAALPPGSSADELSIRHFTTGRMKCQAFVTFPTEEMAEHALNKAHGVVLEGKPLVVCFRKQQSSSGDTTTTTTAQA